MGKQKKHRELTHEEIWDDSALVRSWDEAVEEYQLYHSIHAKGENVEEILRAAETTELTEDREMLNDKDPGTIVDVDAEAPTASGNGMNWISTGHIPEIPVQMEEPQEAAPSTALPRKEAGKGNYPTNAASGQPSNIPSALLGEVQEEGLKNLMMAWYFAGYYTGLYEGQQRVSQGKRS